MAGQFSLNCAGNDTAGPAAAEEDAAGRVTGAGPTRTDPVAVNGAALRRGHWLTGESQFRPHPQERREECAAALLAEIARDHFPALHIEGRSYAQPVCDLVQDAACALADFAAALMAGSHGPGCPGRAEEEAADETCNRGDEPYCSSCGAEIHMLRGMTGWHHLASDRAADDHEAAIEVTDPGHEPALSWRTLASRSG